MLLAAGLAGAGAWCARASVAHLVRPLVAGMFPEEFKPKPSALALTSVRPCRELIFKWTGLLEKSCCFYKSLFQGGKESTISNPLYTIFHLA